MKHATTAQRNAPANRGFTLVELLVSMAVLALLLVLVAQLVDGASLTIARSNKNQDSDSQARMILNRMAIDLGSMVRRSDVDCLVKNWCVKTPTSPPSMPGNDAIYFFSEVPGHFTTSTSVAGFDDRSPVSFVGYHIQENVGSVSAPIWSLERYGESMSWDDRNHSGVNPIRFLVYNTNGTAPMAATTIAGRWGDVSTAKYSKAGTQAGSYTNANPEGTIDNYLTIGDQVFRFEYCYLLKDGTFSLKPYITPATTAPGLPDVSAIVVAIAVLDSNSRKIVLKDSMLSLAKALDDPTEADLSADPPRLMMQTWKAAINAPNFATMAGLPQEAASQVRVYQRIFHLNDK